MSKALAIDVFCKLHAKHFSRSVIAQMTGYSAAYVGRVLIQTGHPERWDHVEDCMADVAQTDRSLAKNCADLLVQL